MGNVQEYVIGSFHSVELDVRGGVHIELSSEY